MPLTCMYNICVFIEDFVIIYNSHKVLVYYLESTSKCRIFNLVLLIVLYSLYA